MSEEKPNHISFARTELPSFVERFVSAVLHGS